MKKNAEKTAQMAAHILAILHTSGMTSSFLPAPMTLLTKVLVVAVNEKTGIDINI